MFTASLDNVLHLSWHSHCLKIAMDKCYKGPAFRNLVWAKSKNISQQRIQLDEQSQIARINASSWCSLAKAFEAYSIQDISLDRHFYMSSRFLVCSLICFGGFCYIIRSFKIVVLSFGSLLSLVCIFLLEVWFKLYSHGFGFFFSIKVRMW